MRLLTTAIDRILKRDRFGNYPRWWQWFFPRYGNWGAPGWSAGCWNPDATDWAVAPVDDMDLFFREHDRAYQNSANRNDADFALVWRLLHCPAHSLYSRLYRLGAMICFLVWPLFRSIAKGLLCFGQNHHTRQR